MTLDVCVYNPLNMKSFHGVSAGNVHGCLLKPSIGKVSNFRFHDLRHSAASYLAMGGASLMEIADILGHKTLSMVKRYAHLSEAHTRNVVQRMNAVIFNGE